MFLTNNCSHSLAGSSDFDAHFSLSLGFLSFSCFREYPLMYRNMYIVSMVTTNWRLYVGDKCLTPLTFQKA